MCPGCEAVWKDEPYYGQVCCCCRMSHRCSCRCNLSSIFKFPDTLIKSSPNPQYILGTASPTPTAVASLTAVPEAASAPLFLSASIALSPLSLSLLYYTPPHSTQTGHSNLVANTTINSSHKEEVLPQKGQDIDRPPSLVPLPVNASGQPLLSPKSTSSLTVQVLIHEDSEEAVLEGQTMSLQDIVETRQNGRKMTSFLGATAKLAAWVGHGLGGSAPHQCR